MQWSFYITSKFANIVKPLVEKFPFEHQFYSSLDVHHQGIIWVVS
jgi:hypothetical protein